MHAVTYCMVIMLNKHLYFKYSVILNLVFKFIYKYK